MARDTGLGITAEQLPTIPVPFTLFDPSMVPPQ
jgi:hypothetical protein